MKTLHETDYVLYDKANDHVVRFSGGDIVIFADREDAEIDCRGNETIIKCTDLPTHLQEELLKQSND